MALASVGFVVTVDFADNSGDVVTRRYPVIDGALYADVLTYATDLITDLEALSDSQIIAYNVTNRFEVSALALPAAGVQNENQIILTAAIEAFPLNSATLTVPAPVIGAFVSPTGPGANVVNTGAAVVTNFLANFEGGGGGKFTVSDGEQIDVSDARGKRRHVKNSNG